MASPTAATSKKPLALSIISRIISPQLVGGHGFFHDEYSLAPALALRTSK